MDKQELSLIAAGKGSNKDRRLFYGDRVIQQPENHVNEIAAILGKSRMETDDPLDDGKMRPTASPGPKMLDKAFARCVKKTSRSRNYLDGKHTLQRISQSSLRTALQVTTAAAWAIAPTATQQAPWTHRRAHPGAAEAHPRHDDNEARANKSWPGH